MAGGVLGRMEDQSGDRRWEPRATHGAHLEQLCGARLTQLVESRIDPRINSSTDLHNGVARFLFGAEIVQLFWSERLPSRVRQQAIEGSSGMSQVKADRRRAARSCPDVVRRHGADQLV